MTDLAAAISGALSARRAVGLGFPTLPAFPYPNETISMSK
jgi:hypothetical protein